MLIAVEFVAELNRLILEAPRYGRWNEVVSKLLAARLLALDIRAIEAGHNLPPVFVGED